MKWYFNDPTRERYDQLPLTPEERKKLNRFGAKLIVIFIIVGTIILLVL
jgi:hypothetical protein